MKTPLIPLLILALFLLLPSCGTHFGSALYQAGTTSARPVEEVLQQVRTYELYRIRDAYYAKVDFAYQPVRYYEYTWDSSMQYSPAPFPACNYNPHSHAIISPDAEKAVFFCPYRNTDSKSCEQLGIPVPTAEQSAGLGQLTEEQAAQGSPILVREFTSQPCNLQGTLLPRSIQDPIPDHKTALHYVALPAAGAAFVLVDIPCTIIGSLFSFLDLDFFL